MKIKRNTITALILGCVLSANITIAENTVSQSELSGSWSTDVATGVDATAFSNNNLSSLTQTGETGSLTYTLGTDVISERTIDYDFDYISEDGVITTYIVNEDGSLSEFWGYIDDVTITTTTHTVYDNDGNEIDSYTTDTYTYNGNTISKSEFDTYFFAETENYVTIVGGVVDLNLTAAATDANAVALSITESDGTTKATLSDKFTPDYSAIENYTDDQIATLLGYMTINATATATGDGDATAVYGNIEHSYLTVSDANGTLFYKEVNGDLTLNLSASTYATYDDTDGWSSGNAIAMDGDLSSSVGNSYVSMTATAAGGEATGISGDISIGNGSVYISATTTDRVVNTTSGGTETLSGGDATVIDGTATFAGTTATLKAVSSSGTALGVETLTITSNGNITIVASGATSATGVTSATLTDSTLTASATSTTDAVGVTTLSATDSNATISASGTDSAIGVTTATLRGDSSLTVYAESTTEAIGVETLNVYIPTETTDTDDIDVKITALSSETAIGIDTLSTISSSDTSFNISAIASNESTTAVTATAIDDDVGFSNTDNSLKGTIGATASSTSGTATAIAINGYVDGNVAATVEATAYSESGTATATAISGNLSGDITGTVKASASSKDSTATAISGNVGGDITGTVIASASGSTATAISGNVSGDITGTAIAVSDSTEDGDNAYAYVITGNVGGTVSGSLIATATASGDLSSATATAITVNTADTTLDLSNATISATATSDTGTATATAIEVTSTGTTLVFDNANISASATTTSGTATSYAINSTESLTIEGDVSVSGNITTTGLTLNDSTLTQTTGELNVGTLNVDANSNYSMSFDVNGELPTFANGTTINFTEAKTAESAISAASGLLTANAATLVGDNFTLANSDDITFDGQTLFDITGEKTVEIEGLYGLDYTITEGSMIFEVTKTTYFEDKATTGNSATLGAALDAIEASADTDWNLAARTMKEEVDGLDLDSFVPYANSFMSQVNAQTYSNISLASVWRMRALMDKGERTKREIAAEAIRNNPAFDGVEPDPEFGFKTRRVAQFQSVNVVASQDGGENAPDYDFISTGGTADIDFALYNNLLLGVGVGGIYNKVDGSDNSGDAESTSFIFNMYAMYSIGNFDIFATLGYAHGFNESEKSTDEGKSKAEWDSDSIFHLAGVSYKIDFKNGLILRPMAMYSLVYQNNGESTSKTSNSYDTTVSSESYFNLKSYIGGEIIYSMTKKLDLVARAFWTHEFGDNSYDFTYTNSLMSQYLSSVAYNGDEADRDAFLLGLSLGYKFTKDISAYLDYNANISGDYLGHNLNAALQVRF